MNLAEDPRNAVLRAKAFLADGYPRNAAKLLRRAVAQDPYSTEAWLLLAQSFVLLGDGKQAVAASRHALSLEPNSELAFEELAEAQLLAGSFAAADQTAVVLIAMRPDSARARDIRGRVALRQKRYADAETLFRDALGLAPSDWRYWNDLGVALQRQGRQEEAMDSFRRAVSANPRSAGVRGNLFRATDAYVGAGGALVFFVVIELLPHLAEQLHMSAGLFDAVVFGGILAAIVWMWLLVRRRTRNLDPALAAFYKSERRREFNIEFARTCFKAGPVVVVAILVILVGAADSDAILPLLIVGAAFAVGWLLSWGRLWRSFLLPRLVR